LPAPSATSLTRRTSVLLGMFFLLDFNQCVFE
jgi:hypothetical protein